MYDESSNEQYFMHKVDEGNEYGMFIRMDVTVLLHFNYTYARSFEMIC